MSEANTTPSSELPAHASPLASFFLWAVRYGIGLVMIFGGVLVLVISPGGFGVDGFAMAVGGGLSVLMLNFLYRLGVSGEDDRRKEELARVYFDEHGEWPEEEAKPKGRRWTLPAGVMMDEDDPAVLSAARQ